MIAPPTPDMPIYLVGAHSTGKTTLARWVRDAFGLPMISEVARGVLAEMEAQLDSIRPPTPSGGAWRRASRGCAATGIRSW